LDFEEKVGGAALKTLILYATKHGATKEAAQRISKKLDGATLHDLKQGGIPSLTEFDCVIIGSPLYAGMIRKEAKTFLAQNAEALCGKRFGLFLCGLDATQEQEFFKSNFPPEVLQAAKATSFLGGIFDPKKAGFIGRLIMKAVAKQAVYTDTIDDGKIAQFIEALKNRSV